ncbi:hypothetical protein HYQ46_010888 [Verticillium longisporum]|nr:hypothetical protein HYQ46_010888 [Verticillium longisporum]KAG7121337.1 hypothetical protein HYQ44_004217 [Verticillium longisporum]
MFPLSTSGLIHSSTHPLIHPTHIATTRGYKRPSLFVQALVAFASEAFVDAGIKPRVQAHFIPACISIRLGEP